MPHLSLKNILKGRDLLKKLESQTLINSTKNANHSHGGDKK